MNKRELVEVEEAEENLLAWAQKVKPVCLVLKDAWPDYLKAYPTGGPVAFIVWLISGCWTKSGDGLGATWEEIRITLAARYACGVKGRAERVREEAKRGADQAAGLRG